MQKFTPSSKRNNLKSGEPWLKSESNDLLKQYYFFLPEY